MTRFSVRWAAPVLAGVALLAAGCDSPPEAEKKAADAAIAAAKSAQADKYAAPAYKAVTDLQRQAETFMGEKKYKEAKAAYEYHSRRRSSTMPPGRPRSTKHCWKAPATRTFH